MNSLKLYMLLLGCTPTGRHTEQHDIFFGIGESLSDLKTDIINSWPEAEGKIHIDGWREVTNVDGYKIIISERQQTSAEPSQHKLFFLNLGGYKRNEFEEYHYKIVTVAEHKGIAVQNAKQTSFYIHTGFEGGASSHIDDKYGVDVDDIYEIEDILPINTKQKYAVIVTMDKASTEDELNLGYLKLEKI
ncbi:MAG: DUF1543 domain-containing protein [Bacteroidetes bacterium]|nr:DUF1543 domain-containing protein [Bacteroidota bacterium]